VLVPTVLACASRLLRVTPEVPLTMHLRSWAESTVHDLALAGASLIFLVQEAWSSLEAVGRSLWRMLISRRQLLEWQTSSDAERTAKASLVGLYMAMWPAPLLAMTVGVVVVELHPGALPAALPLLILWVLAPALSWWLSRPRVAHVPALDADDRAFLVRLSRRTWRFFETFVTAEDRWLPPDNFQEYVLAAPAHRTSPTNIGLALLGNLAAHDFGYLTTAQLLERCGQTTATMLAMERHRGHFFNWYDTRTLEPLQPRYISTVDSGNLAGHLMVLHAGLVELPRFALLPRRLLSGLRHTTLCLIEVIEQAGRSGRRSEVDGLLRQLDEASSRSPATLSGAHAQLGRLLAAAETVTQLRAGGGEEQRWWAAALVR
jgi:hypothetical protein